MKTTKPPASLIVCGMALVFSALPATVLALCDYQPDAPDCACFDDTPVGVWDAGGPSATLPIQDVAADTVGTKESCHTAPPVDDDCGKPYYQLTLGMNTVAGALTASYILSEAATPTYTHRQEWCSETVSYWHREAGIPYTLGYRNTWHEDWRNYSVTQMRTWYEREEDDGGLGRWIRSGEVDYDVAELGVTIPTPGAYMAISCLHPNLWSWCDPAVIDRNHSLMVDEIWIHRDGHGDVFKVEASFYEGNSGRQVKDSRLIDDIFSLTTHGSQWFSYNNGADGVADTADDWGVKIYGFGIALDAAGDPIYDAARVHYVDHPYMRKVLARARPPVTDETWNTFYVSIKDRLAAYTKTLRENDGPDITCSAGIVKATRTPDGLAEKWFFPSSLQDEEVTVEFDFLNKNPLLIHGLSLFWDTDYLMPLGYKVYFGPDKEHYTEVVVAGLAGLKPPPDSVVPMTAKLPAGLKDVRFVKFVFPKGTFTQDALLSEMIVDYDHGPSEDTAEAPEDVPYFVDVRPGECPNLIMTPAEGDLLIAVLGSERFSAYAIETKTLKLNGKKVKYQSVSYKDVATPFIGTDPDCHAEGGDGIEDLVIRYKATDVVEGIGLNFRRNRPTPIVVSGLLNSNYGGLPFLGKDFVTVQGTYWPIFLPATEKHK